MQYTETIEKLRLWTVEEYHRIADMGILAADERIELIEGKIIRMSPKGTAHSSSIGRTDYLLKAGLGNRAWVIVQNPVKINERSEPEPDIAVVRLDPLDYADHHPTPAEIHLIIEIADSSLKFDCETKANLYALAGISDYWVIDVINREVRVFRLPSQVGYRSQVTFNQHQTITPKDFPDLQLRIIDMLPPERLTC
jgi:Uma2 family endonuclease